MSTYSTTTESNINKPILNDELNYQKLQKFNKFYLTNSNFSCKTKTKILSSNYIENGLNIDIPFTPRARTSLAETNIKKVHSRNLNTHKALTKYKTYNNYNKIKNIFNPEILEGEYISKPKKMKRNHCRLEMPSYNTFLGDKIKEKSLGLKINNCIIGNLSKFIYSKNNRISINKNINNIKVKEKINYKKNDTFKESRLSLEKKRRKTMYNIMSKFKQKLNFDKRENLNEYNKFMNTLKINLNVTKLRNKSTKFMYA
jgi:hypothetical protein